MAGPGDWLAWIREAISRAVLDAPQNRLEDYGGQPIYGAPIVGVADGDDPLFARFREVVSDRHLMPREVLEACAGPGVEVGPVRVIAWALPFADEVRRSNRFGDRPSRLYSLARNNGGALNYKMRRDVADLLRAEGWLAVAPLLADGYDAFRSDEHTFSSSWSERHAAFAAGLGQFGLSNALITSVGVHVRIGTVVTNLPVDVTPRPYDDYRAPCRTDGGATCGACIRRCPAGAISTEGLDKVKCNEMRLTVQREFMDTYARTLHMRAAPVTKGGTTSATYSLGCALCQCGVPCEGRIPALPTKGRLADA